MPLGWDGVGVGVGRIFEEGVRDGFEEKVEDEGGGAVDTVLLPAVVVGNRA